MSLRVGFFTSLKVNVGDEFIREGVRVILDRIGIAYDPYYVNKVDAGSLHGSVEDEVEIVADKYWDCDLFIQAGAPVYWHVMGGQHTSLTSDWHGWMWERRILNNASGEGPEFINLGAGSCDAWGGTCERFLQDAECVAFARAAGQRARLTTVRDPIAAQLLQRLDIAHHALPCPAFLAGARRQTIAPGQVIGINLMPLGGHYDYSGDFNAQAWQEECRRLCNLLRKLGPLVFICHDQTEADYARKMAAPGERVFLAPGWRAYLDMYGQCAIVVANRVHGATIAAGLGIPSVILGTDTRAHIGDYIGIPIHRSGAESADTVFALANRQFEQRQTERQRLLALREQTIRDYAALLEPIVRDSAETRARRRPPIGRLKPSLRLGSVEEINSARFGSFMADINRFAAAHGLRQFTDWSKVWEYPWLWFAVLGRIDWMNKTLVDLGSELSPMPWFISCRGAKSTLVEVHGHLVPTWEKLRETLKVEAEFKVVPSERLPFPDESVDVVTSFSVIEHQPDKELAISEVARVLKPGGIFAVSFDICEPSMGMTFPEWNGKALSLGEFERIVWRHPAFGNQAAPAWNTRDIPDFLQWHKQSAAHHNYVVGAAVLIKR